MTFLTSHIGAHVIFIPIFSRKLGTTEIFDPNFLLILGTFDIMHYI